MPTVLAAGGTAATRPARGGSAMDTTSDPGKAAGPERAIAPEAEGATAAPSPASDHPFGPDAAAILATEHWSLLASRSLIWNEAISRATVFLSVLSAAMNRLRHAYLEIAPALEPYFTTGHHDDEQGLAASYLADGPRLRRWGQFLVNTPTIVATVDAGLAAAIVVLVARAAEAATTVAVAAGAVAFLVVWAVLFSQQRRALDPLRRTTPRFPTPPDQAGTAAR